MTFLVKRTVIFISRIAQPGLYPRTNPVARWLKTFVDSYRPAGWFLNLPLLVFALICILSTIFSQDHALSLKGLIFKWLEGILVYFGFMEGIKSKKQLKVLLVIFFISAGLVALNGLVQGWQGTGFVRGRTIPPDGRICSTLKHSNDFSGYLLMVLPLVISVLGFWYWPAAWQRIKAKTSQKIGRVKIVLLGVILALLFSVLFYDLGLTYSRGGWLGFGLALMIMVLFRRKFLFFALILVAILALYFMPQMRAVRNIKLGQGSVPSVTQRTDQQHWFAQLMTTLDHFTGGGMGRGGFWREAWHMIMDYPILGAGLNTYSKLGEGYKINWGGYPHNCYLHIAAETGLLGLAGFVWMLAVFFRNSFRNLSRIRDPVLNCLLLGYLAGFSGFMLQSFVDTNIYSVQLGVLFWLILAMIVKIQQIGIKPN